MQLQEPPAPSRQEQLTTKGYCRFGIGDGLDGEIDWEAGAQRFADALEHLPADPYGRSRNRYRRYSQAVLLPWSRTLDWVPSLIGASGPYTEYFQGDYNPEFHGVHRRFSSLTESLQSDPVLQRLIWHDFALTTWSEGQMVRPFMVGVHMIKLMVEEAGNRAVSSPDQLHQDGEPYTFVHLIRRDNALGAANVLAPPHCSGCRPDELSDDFILDEFELHNPLDSYGVNDRAVSHYVSPLQRGPHDRPGVRAAILIDFTPLITVTPQIIGG
jgi:hypothetical protein